MIKYDCILTKTLSESEFEVFKNHFLIKTIELHATISITWETDCVTKEKWIEIIINPKSLEDYNVIYPLIFAHFPVVTAPVIPTSSSECIICGIYRQFVDKFLANQEDGK